MEDSKEYQIKNSNFEPNANSMSISKEINNTKNNSESKENTIQNNNLINLNKKSSELLNNSSKDIIKANEIIEKKKPFICKFFIKNLCTKGDNCDYIHNENSLSFQQQFKKMNCRYFSLGMCNSSCKFNHELLSENRCPEELPIWYIEYVMNDKIFEIFKKAETDYLTTETKEIRLKLLNNETPLSVLSEELRIKKLNEIEKIKLETIKNNIENNAKSRVKQNAINQYLEANEIIYLLIKQPDEIINYYSQYSVVFFKSSYYFKYNKEDLEKNHSNNNSNNATSILNIIKIEDTLVNNKKLVIILFNTTYDHFVGFLEIVSSHKYLKNDCLKLNIDIPFPEGYNCFYKTNWLWEWRTVTQKVNLLKNLNDFNYLPLLLNKNQQLINSKTALILCKFMMKILSKEETTELFNISIIKEEKLLDLKSTYKEYIENNVLPIEDNYSNETIETILLNSNKSNIDLISSKKNINYNYSQVINKSSSIDLNYKDTNKSFNNDSNKDFSNIIVNNISNLQVNIIPEQYSNNYNNKNMNDNVLNKKRNRYTSYNSNNDYNSKTHKNNSGNKDYYNNSYKQNNYKNNRYRSRSNSNNNNNYFGKNKYNDNCKNENIKLNKHYHKRQRRSSSSINNNSSIYSESNKNYNKNYKKRSNSNSSFRSNSNNISNNSYNNKKSNNYRSYKRYSKDMHSSCSLDVKPLESKRSISKYYDSKKNSSRFLPSNKLFTNALNKASSEYNSYFAKSNKKN